MRKTLFNLAIPTLASFAVAAGAQSYDPQKHSPLTLLKAPADPLAYYDARKQLRALLNGDKPAQAEVLAERVASEYPRDGENWFMLGQVKMAVGEYSAAADAFEKSAKLLWFGGPGYSTASAAGAYLKAGNKRAALDALRQYTVRQGAMDRDWIYGDEDFATLKSDPEFREIAGRPDSSGWSREEGWRRDVDFVRDELLRLNPELRNHSLPPKLDQQFSALKARVPALSDEQMLVELNRLLAGLRQGHTAIQPVGGSLLPPYALPFQFWTFPDGIYIVDASAEYKNLIGSRLVSIEDVPATEALRRINAIQSVDGDNEYLYEGTRRLRSVPLLMGLGIAKAENRVRVVVEQPDTELAPIEVNTITSPTPQRLKPVPGTTPPLYLQELDQANFIQELPKQDATYVRFNMYDPKQSDFALQLRAQLAQSPRRNLILDMRFNDGGSTQLYSQLLRTVIGFSLLPNRKVYVLIGRTTYSAAGNLITELEQLADATFVGEASSECCTFYANPSIFRLPYSKLWGRMSTIRVNLSRKGQDFRREMNPDVPVILSAGDYFAGRDPVMEAVGRLIARDATG